MTLRARILTDFDILVTSALDLGAVSVPMQQQFRQAFDTGGGQDQAQIAFGDQRPLTASQTDTLDLAGGLTGGLGGALTFTALKELFLWADPTNTGDLRVGKALANCFVGPFGASAIGILLPPGGIIHLRNPTAAGWAVTAGTGDLMTVENLVAAAANYTAILIGEGS
jgi:hypothetical protein